MVVRAKKITIISIQFHLLLKYFFPSFFQVWCSRRIKKIVKMTNVSSETSIKIPAPEWYRRRFNPLNLKLVCNPPPGTNSAIHIMTPNKFTWGKSTWYLTEKKTFLCAVYIFCGSHLSWEKEKYMKERKTFEKEKWEEKLKWWKMFYFRLYYFRQGFKHLCFLICLCKSFESFLRVFLNGCFWVQTG